jgi:hypothetical protein
MKKHWTLGSAALLMSGALGCADASSNEGLVARVGDYELTVEDVAELMVNEERLPAQVTVVRQVADLWIEYTLLGAAVSLDTALRSVEFAPLVRQQLDQMIILQLRDSVLQVDTVIPDDELRELYAAEVLGLEPGELSGLVETQYGLHLIRLEQRRIQDFGEIAPDLRQQVLTERFLQADSAYIANIETRAQAEPTEGAFGVLRELARNPGTRLSSRARRRPVFEYVGGELTVQLVLQSQTAELRDQVVAGDEEQLDRFLRGIVQREVLTEEADAAGFGVPAERIDSMIDNARAQLRGAAEVLGLVSIDRAPGELLNQAVARAVLEAVGKVLTGATEVVRLGGIEFQLGEGSSSAVFDRGVSEAILRIVQLRMNRGPSLLEEAADPSSLSGDTVSGER